MNNLWCTNYSSVRTNTRFTVFGAIFNVLSYASHSCVKIFLIVHKQCSSLYFSVLAVTAETVSHLGTSAEPAKYNDIYCKFRNFREDFIFVKLRLRKMAKSLCRLLI